ncbi:MAG TPA: hypothetical protein DEP82_14495 [Arthrobacter bacterium]|jgi:hypothetical protein|nr:hypothetical protein [Arthrobacter sp.]HCB59081.1 hypothetical protein [Arthrobacter sp.]
MDIPKRIAHRVTINRNGCWIFTGAIDKAGYGVIYKLGTGSGKGRRNEGVHRYTYRECVGEIPAGYDVDHACHNEDKSCPGGEDCVHRACCNPEHLRAATRGDNLRDGRGYDPITHCIKGHDVRDPDNQTRPDKRSGRVRCLTCVNQRTRDYRKRQKERLAS